MHMHIHIYTYIYIYTHIYIYIYIHIQSCIATNMTTYGNIVTYIHMYMYTCCLYNKIVCVCMRTNTHDQRKPETNLKLSKRQTCDANNNASQACVMCGSKTNHMKNRFCVALQSSDCGAMRNSAKSEYKSSCLRNCNKRI